MRLYKNNDLKVILKVVSVNLNIPEEVVIAVFSQYYKDIAEILQQQEKDDILNYPSIRIPKFGTLYVSDRKKKQLDKIFKEYKWKKKLNCQSEEN
jgi:hypothetical protein